jgi:hypothetical protein
VQQGKIVGWMRGDHDVSNGRQEAFAKLYPGCYDKVFVLVLEANTRAYFQSDTRDNGDRSAGHRLLQRIQNVLVLGGLS